jgi:AcrR family transcriptional regulator
MGTGIDEPATTSSANGTSARQTGRRLEIVAQAAQVFAASSYHTVGMREVAAAAGLRGASLYNHFSSKEEILYEIALSVTRDTVEGCISILDAPGRIVDRLAALIRTQLFYVAARRVELLVTLSELKELTDGHRRRVLEYRTYYQRRVRDVIVAGHCAGDFHTQNARLATTALMDMLNSVSAWYRPEMDVGSLADDYIRLGIGGLLGYRGDVDEVCRIAVELSQKSGVQVPNAEPATE